MEVIKVTRTRRLIPRLAHSNSCNPANSLLRWRSQDRPHIQTEIRGIAILNRRAFAEGFSLVGFFASGGLLGDYWTGAAPVMTDADARAFVNLMRRQ